MSTGYVIDEQWCQDHLNTSTLHSWVDKGTGEIFTHKMPCKRITFMNGGSLSFQASEFAHCSPRDNTGPWTHVEVGFPEGLAEDAVYILRKFAGYDDDDVISCVPIGLIVSVATLCGGVTEVTYNHKKE